ncbi:MAG: sulfate ABC transporter ATP-binding protein, partial [Propionibacterium sp.]
TTLDHHLIRPHDITVYTEPVPNTVAGTIVRWQRIGFEVRLSVRPDGATDESSDVTVKLTRTFARAIGLDDGARVWLEPEKGATRIPVLESVDEQESRATAAA